MRRVVSGTGRLLITLGILILLFVAYQLWGTGIYQARAQDDLENQFQEAVERQPTTTTAPPTTLPPEAPTTTTTLAPLVAPPLPAEGEAVMRIRIPRIGLDQIVVEGTAVDDLRKGPGHYVGTPIAGQIGNTGIAGHRTTYGAPFGELGELETGDEIFVQTLTGDWRYVLTEDPFVVKPSQTVVLLPRTQRNALTGVEETQTTLTLTTCHPKYSAAERLIVNAHLEDAKPPAPPPPLPVASKAPDLGLSGERQSRTPTVLWGLLTLAVGLLWWLWFHRHPRWTTWFTGLIPFAIALTGFYFFLERVLPNNY